MLSAPPSGRHTGPETIWEDRVYSLRPVDKRPHSIMLVRVERADEPAALALDDPEFEVLRVKHPLPACVRMAVMRPLVVVVGPSVLERDRALLSETGQELDAVVVDYHLLANQRPLASWLQRTFAGVQAMRERRRARVSG